MHSSVLLYAPVYPSVEVYVTYLTLEYSHTLQCTLIHSSVLSYTPVYSHTLQCTLIHSSVLSYTPVYSCMLQRTQVQMYTSHI
jgi:hypothetical protein